MSPVACHEAKEKGIEVLCLTWELADLDSGFDLIVALDLLEHANDASCSLNKIGKILRRGGYVVIETGNADSWAAKSLKEDWGYPAVYGHLQVLSPETLLNLDREAEIKPISLIKGRHASENFNHILYCGMLAYGFHFLKLAYSALKHFTGELYSLSKLLDRGPPAANLGDHMILIGRKV